ncbi:MAG: hypothetical protein KatS3mg068_0339 [Candidatus Sericytochromatia bacterium]|nr:MAG: hypothetical protein KatS3mg068_0339 [Candidatus Sericytochromatia bacterium]
MNLKKLFSIFISISITSCSLPLNNTNKHIDNSSKSLSYYKNLNTEKLSFKTKGIVTYEEDNVSTSAWQTINNSNASGGAYKFYDSRPAILQDDNQNSTYVGTWLSINDTNAYGGSYRLTNQRPIQNYEENVLSYTGNWVYGNIQGSNVRGSSNVPGGINILNTDTNIVYSASNWITSGDKTYINSTSAINISHTSVGSPYNLIYKYNNNTQSQTWSENMTGGWNNTYWNGVSVATWASTQSRSVEFLFTGTNVRIFQRKGPTMGICSIKVYNSNNQEVKSLQVDNYSPTIIAGTYTDIFGLKNDTYKVVIQGPITKNPNSTGWNFFFAGAKVYPSIEYSFTGDNISYIPYVSSNSGQVRISIDGDNPEIIDLYNPTTTKQVKKQYFNLPYGNHRITIEALDTKNPLSSGYEVNISQFRMFQSVSGTFTGDSFIVGAAKFKAYGQADLYIDGNLVDADQDKPGTNPIDFYENYSSSKLEVVAIIKGLTNTTHRFSIVGKGFKNNSSTGRVFYIDFVGSGFPYFEKTFEGYDQAIFGLRGPDYGLVNIYVNGSQVDGNPDTPEIDPVDLYRPTYNLNEIITYRYFSSSFSRTIKIEQTFKKNPLSNGYKIACDYFGSGGLLAESAYINFSGTSISLRVRKGPDMGIMLVGIDGAPAGKIDLYNPSESFEEVNFENLSNISHYLTLQSEGTKNILSTGYGISIDAYYVYNPYQPQINSFNPISAGIGEWITIEGENFNLDPTKNEVKINGITLRIIDVIDVNTENSFAEKIIAEIPVGLTGNGFIQVKNTQLNVTGISSTQLIYSNKPVALFNVTPEYSNTTSTVFQFDASPSYDIEDGNNLLYKWDFGDGTVTDFSSSKTATHTFSTTGYKTIKMIVKDQTGKEAYTDKTIYIGSLSTGWTELAPIPSTRYMAGASVINGKIYLVGGNNSGPRRNVFEYDINSDTWWNPNDNDSDPCNGPYVRCIPSETQGVPAFTYNGKIIVFNDRLYKMDTPNLPDFIGNWTDYGNESKYPFENFSALGAAMAIINNKLYIAGGLDIALNPSKKFVSFDLITRTWDTSLPDLPENFTLGAFGAVNNKLYVIGGRDSSSTISDKVRIFDVNNPSLGWTYGANLDIPTAYSASVVLNNKIYLMGGITPNGITNKVKIYDTTTNSWSNGLDMPLFPGFQGYSNSASTVVGNQIFVISGISTNTFNYSYKVLRYVPN